MLTNEEGDWKLYVTQSDVLWVSCWFISHENQVGYDSSDGNMNYTLWLRSYVFDQVIFIVGLSVSASRNIFHS